MMPRRILYTRFDGGVTICHPAPECLAWLSCGGWWDGKGLDIDEQIERAVEAGHHEWAARRFVRAMDKGGCTTAEGYEIIRDRDCGHLGTAFDLCDIEDLPDQWFRDAWRRSHNGGPISIDLAAARKIQFARIEAAIDSEAKRRSADIDRFDAPFDIPLGPLRDRIHKAQDETELRHIWPEKLS